MSSSRFSSSFVIGAVFPARELRQLGNCEYGLYEFAVRSIFSFDYNLLVWVHNNFTLFYGIDLQLFKYTLSTLLGFWLLFAVIFGFYDATDLFEGLLKTDFLPLQLSNSPEKLSHLLALKCVFDASPVPRPNVRECSWPNAATLPWPPPWRTSCAPA